MRHRITQPDVHSDPRQDRPPAAPATMAFLWSRTSLLKEVWDLVQAVGAWPNVAVAHDRTGICFALGGVTLGHLRWNGRLDLPFGPAVRDQLVAEEMATPDPDHPDTGRVVFDIRAQADVDRAVWLLRLAYLSVDSKVNPRAPDLARLRGARR